MAILLVELLGTPVPFVQTEHLRKSTLPHYVVARLSFTL